MTAAFRIVIPARYGSTRFPGKPLASLLGRPMIEHVWHRACEAGASEVVVATDDERIGEAATRFGATVCMTRSDHAQGTDRIAEVAARHAWPDDAIVVNLQGDEPAMPPSLLAAVARDLEEHPDAAIATLATPAEASAAANPNVVKVVTDERGYALYFSRAPIPYRRDGAPVDTEPAMLRHLGVYAYRAAFLHAYGRLAPAPLERAEQLEQLRALWHGYRIHVDHAGRLPGTGVDTPEDLERVAREVAAMTPGEGD